MNGSIWKAVLSIPPSIITGFGNLEAVKLHELGYKVFAGFRNPGGENAQKLKSETSDRVHVLQLDVTSDESVKNAGQYVRDNLGECCK